MLHHHPNGLLTTSLVSREEAIGGSNFGFSPIRNAPQGRASTVCYIAIHNHYTSILIWPWHQALWSSSSNLCLFTTPLGRMENRSVQRCGCQLSNVEKKTSWTRPNNGVSVFPIRVTDCKFNNILESQSHHTRVCGCFVFASTWTVTRFVPWLLLIYDQHCGM